MRSILSRHAIFLSPLLILLASNVVAAREGIHFSNTAKYSVGRYTWTIYVKGPSDVLANIDHVQYTLHESFPKPVQDVYERGGACAFALSSTAWGEFEIKIRVFFKNKTSTDFSYWLNLLNNKNSGTECTSTKKNPPATRTPRRRG